MDLEELYRKQQELDDFILKKRYCPTFITKEDHKAFLNERMLAAFVEMGELCNEVEEFKYWKEHKKCDREKQLKEYVDWLHFFLSIGNTLDFKPHEVENKYNEVYEDNILRQQSNY